MALSYAELEGLWIQAGGDPSQAATMAAVAMAESGGNPDALNATDNGGKQSSYGLWQVSTGTHTAPSPNWADPLTNAQLAVQKMQTQGITAWGTYDSGIYQQFLQSGVAPAEDTSMPNAQGGPSPANEPSTSSSLNVQTPQDFASAVLSYMGIDPTQSDIDFIVAWSAREGGNWGNTASYNPLNTTLQMPGSTVMSGGNSAGVQAYTSWAQGIQATAQTLQNGDYGQIVAALQSGNPDTANSNGTLSSELETWSGRGYSQVDLADANYNPGASPNSNQGSLGQTSGTGTGAGQLAGGSTAGVDIPSISDISALNAYIQTNYPDEAWLLQIPSVAGVLENAVASGDTTDAIVAAVENTEWWTTTSAANRQYLQNLAENPADYSFTTPGSTAAQQLTEIQTIAAQQGVTLTASQAQSLATQSLQYGWTTAQIQQNIGSTVSVTGAPGDTSQFSSITGQPTTDTAASVVQQLNSIAGNYAQLQSNSSLQQWAQQIAGGTQTIQSFTAAMAQQAAGQFPALASGLSQGQTVTQLLQSQINQMSQLLEVDPSQIESGLLTDPSYSKILTGGTGGSSPAMSMTTGSGSGTATSVSGGTPMTTSEVAQYTRGLPQWQTTQNARDTGAQVSQTILQAFGASPVQ